MCLLFFFYLANQKLFAIWMLSFTFVNQKIFNYTKALLKNA